MNLLQVPAVDDKDSLPTPGARMLATDADYGAADASSDPFTGSEIRIAIENALRRLRLEAEDAHGMIDALGSTEQLRHAQVQMIRLLGRALQYRDEETSDHLERVSRYCALLGARLGLNPESLRLASTMHDIGKIGVPDRILRKPGLLTPDERLQMERHTEIGRAILAGGESHLLDLAASIAWTHHERWDGVGYPRGLTGTAIPLEGRIVAVADVFDALTTARVYRGAISVPRAVAVMESESGEQFDPHVLDLFVDSLDDVLAIKRRFRVRGTTSAGGGGAPAATAPARVGTVSRHRSIQTA